MKPGVRCTTSDLVCTSCTRDVQENAAIGLGRHVFSTPIFGLLLDLEGHRAKGLQVRHTLSTSYSALVGQLFQTNGAQD